MLPAQYHAERPEIFGINHIWGNNQVAGKQAAVDFQVEHGQQRRDIAGSEYAGMMPSTIAGLDISLARVAKLERDQSGGASEQRVPPQRMDEACGDRTRERELELKRHVEGQDRGAGSHMDGSQDY